MKTIYILFIGLLVSGGVLAQSCLPEGITVETQAQIDSFQIIYPNCTEIEGAVRIEGDDITNLNGLSVVTSIGGGIYIYSNSFLMGLEGLEGLTSIGGGGRIGSNSVLTSLTGLDNLTSIGGELNIYTNSALTSLTGLENLTSIGGELNIYTNPVLTSLTGLEGLTSIGNDLRITFNYALTSLSGLDNVTSIGRDLVIKNNKNALTSLTGLNNLTSIGRDLVIKDNDALTSLTGLDNLTSIGRDLGIQHNNFLTSLTGLNNLTSIGSFFWIEDNDALTSLTGLDNIDATSIDSLYIHTNMSLSTCEVRSVCDYLSNPSGTVSIYNNGTGCNSQEEVETACENASVAELNQSNRISIYPNPSSTQITIELPTQPSKNTSLTISNTNGQQLITQPITELQTEIDISSLPTGIYIVKVWNDKEVMVQKVIKQ